MSEHTVIVVGGPAGTGKSTIADLISKHLGCPFVEGDALHPPENVAKMAEATPLTDDDRWEWLANVSLTTAEKASHTKVAVVSCSMLKKVYREYIKSHSGFDTSVVKFRFVFLHTTFEELIKRVGHRQGHFMKSDMVKSQFDIMEIPTEGELLSNGGDALDIDTTNKDPEAIFNEIVSALDISQ